MQALFLAETHNDSILFLLTLVLVSVVLISLFFSKIKQSLLAGYFLCGVIIANCGLIDMGDYTKSVDLMAEIGVVLLMFSIGIEFSLNELKHLKKFLLIGGGIQMGVCAGVFSLAFYVFDLPLAIAGLMGTIVGLSSTAVALKSFQETNKAGTSAAKLALGIALFQDIVAILLMATMPALVKSTSEGLWGVGFDLAFALFHGAIFLVGAGLFGKYVVPSLMRAIAKTRVRELFTLSVLSLCACIAIGAELIGLSLALGAFTAGLIVSGSYYSHRVLSEISPFRDLFLTIFFVSAGFLVDLSVLVEKINLVVLVLIGISLVKFIVILVAASRLKLSGAMGILSASALANVGEFSLVLLTSLGRLYEVPAEILQCMFAVTALSMGLTPTYVKFALRYGSRANKWWGFKSTKETSVDEKIKVMNHHAIICGYGPVGRRLHEALLRYGIPCIIVDLNAETIKGLLKDNVPALLADIQHSITLELVNVKEAALIAFTFPDISPALAAKPEILELNPGIHIMARAKFANEVERLWNAGIKSIIHDEVEVGHSMKKEALKSFHIMSMGEMDVIEDQKI